MAGSGRDERAWIRGARDGSVADLEALFRHHWPRAYRAAYLVVHDAAAAEDIAQESFLAAVRALDRFDFRRPFGPWLHRIAVNRAIDWARARALRAETEELDVAAPAALVAAAVTPPGRSVVNSLRDAVGREKVVGVRPAHRELVRLPTGGKLLLESPSGAYIV